VRELPSGTVTFLFSDVEGSTRLLREHGERYAELLSEHRVVLRDAFARHGGVEVDTQGDAFFVAFARASDALAAAVEAQAKLRESPISVRMGIHTGEPVVTNVVELCGRSSILRRDLGDEWGTALALCNVAIAELQLGRLSSAAASLRVALETSVKVDAKMVVAGCIDTSVLIAAALGNMREAALLAGASERLYEELGSIRDSFEAELFARTDPSIRASLGANAYTDAIQHGRELTLEEAAACALTATGALD
jgi:predicted nucleic acid-binding protein